MNAKTGQTMLKQLIIGTLLVGALSQSGEAQQPASDSAPFGWAGTEFEARVRTTDLALARSGQCTRTMWNSATSPYQRGFAMTMPITSWAVFGGNRNGARVRAVFYYLEPFGQSAGEIRRNAHRLVWLEAGRAWIAYRAPEEVPPLLNPWDPTGGGVFEIMPEAVEGVGLCAAYESIGTTFQEPVDRERRKAAARARDEQSVDDYIQEVKRRIEDHWTYPAEASRKGQSGQAEVRFVIRADHGGTPTDIEIVRSTGTPVLDRYAMHAIKMAAPFPRLPAKAQYEPLVITMSFTYQLGGTRQIEGQ